MSQLHSCQNKPKNMCCNNLLKSTKTALDKIRPKKTYTNKLVSYLLTFLENPMLENRQVKMKDRR